MILGSKHSKNTLLLLHLDGNVIDSSFSNITISKTGTAFVTGVFGQGLSFSPTNPDAIRGKIPALGIDDFTIDCWVYRNSAIAYQKFAETGGDSTAGSFNFDAYSSGSHLRFYATGGNQALSNTLLPVKAWIHIAAVRKGGILALYQNGQFVGTASMPTNFSTTTLTVRAPNCIIDEFRISNIARWTSNFTPPTKPY